MTAPVQEAAEVAESMTANDRPEHRLVIQALIDRARSAPLPSKAPWLLGPLSAVFLYAAFTPLDWGWLAWLALVPMLCLARFQRPLAGTVLASWLAGAIFWFPTLQWMRLGDATMYPAWIAMAFYTSLYFPLFMIATRLAVHRFAVPLVFAAPLVWVGLEFARAHFMTGFAWYLLGHSQHRWAAITQISDLVGGYGVSFLVVMVNACMATLIPIERLRRFAGIAPTEGTSDPSASAEPASRRMRFEVVTTLLLVALSLGYGFIRLNQTDFPAGPRVGLVQGSFDSTVKGDPQESDRIFKTYLDLHLRAVREGAELIVWPESMLPYPLMESPAGLADKELAALHPLIPAERWKDGSVQIFLRNMSDEARASVIIGIDRFQGQAGHAKHYNSAVFVQPGVGIQGRYDKLHRVPFGEYIPLRDWIPGLHKFTPYAEDFGLDAGEAITIFRHRECRLLPLICYEDTVPHLVRSSVAASRLPEDATGGPSGDVGCLVNLTNDGWFHGSSEHDQHLITASFRCIENRVPMIRAVNTGISAIIDGNGRLRDPDVLVDLDRLKARKSPKRNTMIDPETGKLPKLANVTIVGQIPLDPRESLYVLGGDWFAMGCLVATLFALGAGMMGRKPKLVPG